MDYKEIKTSLFVPKLCFVLFNIFVLIIFLAVLLSTKNLEFTLNSISGVAMLFNFLALAIFFESRAESIRLYDDKIEFIYNCIIYKKVVQSDYLNIKKIDAYYFNRQEILEFMFKDKKSYKTSRFRYSPDSIKEIYGYIKNKNPDIKIDKYLLED